MHSRPVSSYRHCQKLARASGSNFYCAFLTLPRDMFRDMCVLYAFMRHTDDLGDAADLEPAERATELTAWRNRLEEALSGRPVDDPILPAVAHMAHRRGMPSELLHEVIDGVAGDLQPRTFENFEELEHYCYQVAGVVGLCCLAIWGYRGQEPRAPAIACGTAFQLTNILRDIPEDLAAGRIYLPLDDLTRFGYAPTHLYEGLVNPAFRNLMEFEVQRAWTYYVRALPLLDELHPPGRRILSSFLEIYATLLREIERADYDVFTRRIALSKWKKASLSVRCLFGRPIRFTLAAPASPSGSPRPPKHSAK